MSTLPSPDLGSAPRILIVDDEPFVLRVVERLLFRAGYQATAVTSAEEALESLRRDRESIGLLVTDLSLPGPGGPGLVREARRLRPGLPVLYMRSRVEDALDARAEAPVLTKPFGSRQLYGAVASLLAEDGRRPRPAPRKRALPEGSGGAAADASPNAAAD